MDYTLTEEQEQLRRLVEEFVAREVKFYWEKHGYEGFPWPLFRKLGEIGLAAIPFPTEYGGGGLDTRATRSCWKSCHTWAAISAVCFQFMACRS